MNGDKVVGATFPYAFMAEVDSIPQRYDTLAQAWAGAASSDTIFARDVIVTENLILNWSKAIYLMGGWAPTTAPGSKPGPPSRGP